MRSAGEGRGILVRRSLGFEMVFVRVREVCARLFLPGEMRRRIEELGSESSKSELASTLLSNQSPRSTKSLTARTNAKSIRNEIMRASMQVNKRGKPSSP